jgi:hypothetical protein
VFSRAWGKPRYGALASLGVAAAGAAMFWLYFRRRRRQQRDAAQKSETRSPSALLATELYERLDAAMNAKGIARAPGMPPLRHAEALNALGHPLADEILDLTDVYLRARFGGEAISTEARKDFEDRVKGIRSAILPAGQLTVGS